MGSPYGGTTNYSDRPPRVHINPGFGLRFDMILTVTDNDDLYRELSATSSFLAMPYVMLGRCLRNTSFTGPFVLSLDKRL